ncbi:MAG: NYN domain-containing protein [Proteobacteria bacterium]|nr:NYN domain-containing protein [Pseudomonadota bacterium]
MARAIVYIDGYNLYFSRLRGTPHKWLDLVALFRDHILCAQIPDAEVVAVKYFTAPAMGKFASHGLQSVTSQNEYHRALKARHQDRLQIILGYHAVEEARLMSYQEPPDKLDRLSVWRIEEKQTDVNIALSVYRDVAHGDADVVVICSNDSDLVPAAKALRQDFPHCQLGIVAPLPEPRGEIYRRANTELRELADWTRHYIRDEELVLSQLPDVVPTRKKAARKPPYW